MHILLFLLESIIKDFPNHYTIHKHKFKCLHNDSPCDLTINYLNSSPNIVYIL